MAFFWGDARTVETDDRGQATPAERAEASALLAAALARLAGVGCLAIALALGAALASYEAADPGLFVATGRAPTNWLGEPGAILADALMQGLGLASWGIVALIGAWGWRLVSGRGDERFWGRLIAMLPALGALAIFAALHAPGEGWPLASGLGGLLGDRGAMVLLQSIGQPPEAAALQLTLGAGIATLVLGGLALGVTLAEAVAAMRWIAGSLAATLAPAGRLVRRAPAAAAEAMQPPRAPRSERLEPAEPAGRARRSAPPEAEWDEDDGADAPETPRTPSRGIARRLIGVAGTGAGIALKAGARATGRAAQAAARA
ncbi:MAG: DNA translocase FtsK 4TM domain-containing protein, partial [Pseudomonadota bacterium]